MNSMQFLVDSVLGFFGYVLFFRLWFQYCNIEYYHPTSQWLVKVTQPLLGPLGKILPTIKRVNLAALVVIFILGMLIALTKTGENFALAAIIGGLTTVKIIGKGIMYILFFGAILSWFQSPGNQQIQYILFKLGEPVLAPIRKILPRTGMVDFSPMVALFILFFLHKFLLDMLGLLWQIA